MQDMFENLNDWVNKFNDGARSIKSLNSNVKLGGNLILRVIAGGRRLVGLLVSRPRNESEEEPTKKVQDVAVIIEITRPIRTAVEQYLQEKGDIDHTFIITSLDGDGRIGVLEHSQPAEWADQVRGFYRLLNNIQRELGGAKVHFFISAPVVLSFGLGAMWGTVNNATLYHWAEGSYHPVLDVGRTLKR